MRLCAFIVFWLLFNSMYAQMRSPDRSSIFYGLEEGDSIVVYQCHVDIARTQILSASGQTINGAPQKCTITEKFVILKTGSDYEIAYYNSALSIFPNRRFSGLKIRERYYWDFTLAGRRKLEEQDMKVILALEQKGREAIEYDYAITKHTTNQVIYKKRSNFKELVIDGNYVISKLLKFT